MLIQYIQLLLILPSTNGCCNRPSSIGVEWIDFHYFGRFSLVSCQRPRMDRGKCVVSGNSAWFESGPFLVRVKRRHFHDRLARYWYGGIPTKVGWSLARNHHCINNFPDHSVETGHQNQARYNVGMDRTSRAAGFLLFGVLRRRSSRSRYADSNSLILQ